MSDHFPFMRLVPLIIVGMVIFSGCTLWPFDNTAREGFSASDLTIPTYYSYSSSLQHKPDDTLFITPSHPYRLAITFSPVYVSYGGIAKITLENTGINDLFIYNYGVNVDDNEWLWRDDERGFFVPAGGESTAYVAFRAPSVPGEYRQYRLSVYTMVNNGGSILPSPEDRWHDNGVSTYTNDDFSNLTSIKVRMYNSSSSYSPSHNYYYHYDKINDLVNIQTPAILNTVGPIVSAYGASYNIYKVCAIFDYLQEKLDYCIDPVGEDIWSSPAQTLQQGCGDCEDYALLFSTLVSSIGGTVRVYMTDNHAFAGVYIGKPAKARQIIDDLHEYYGTNYFVAILEDDFGQWLVADCLSSFFLGSLPVGSGAVGPPRSGYENEFYYTWDFTQTGSLNIIDVLRG